ncbi:Conserved_hypothetical protein [Hexamita inflata]|uniref:Uncharacterized protein n=1 Tax=Hexamita inflata TaxID=28002 RepID=A0AA86PRP1_9EUKA|nr:Conserved hypothetical protein [Hexamita inflata]
MFVVQILTYVNQPQTELLSVEEPVGSYPYTRQELSCYRAINKLVVDIASNSLCIHLERLKGGNCSQFPQGVLYDLSFNNHVTWRTQQRDYNYFTTNSFCFPCYNSDCSFITGTTLASMHIKSEIYTSLIPIGAIVIQKSNQSDCYDGSVSALRRSSTNQMLKLYPKSACAYVFTDCVMTKYVEEKYRDTLISSETTDVSLSDWNTFKVPVVDQFGSYFRILQTASVNLNDGLLYSVFRIYYQCPNMLMEHTAQINYITSYEHPNFGTGASAIIENKYIGFQMLTVQPSISSEQFTQIRVQVQLTNTKTNEIENVFDFDLSAFNFQKQYLYCDQVTDMLYKTEGALGEQCEHFLSEHMHEIEYLAILFSFKFNSIFATYLVTNVKSGCWSTVTVSNANDQLCFTAVSANLTGCPLIQEQKSTVNAIVNENGEYTSVTSDTKYYSVDGMPTVCLPCDSVCQEKISKKNVLMTIQSLVTDTSYSEIWMEYQEQADTTKDPQIPLIGGICCGILICVIVVYESLVHCFVKARANKKKIIKVNEIKNDMDENFE